MKIKIVDGPLSSYTGLFSGVPFLDGFSEREVTPKEARSIGINVKIINVETGEQAGVSESVGHIPAAPLVPANTDHEEPKAVEAKPVALKTEVADATVEATKKYTKEDLEKIAAEDGIRGIRAVANEFGVKGVQIAQMVDDILKAQD